MNKSSLRRHAPLLAGAALLALLAVGVWLLLDKVLNSGGAQTKKTVQQISLIQPPPPPPPPPKVEEKPPEPVKDEVKVNEPPPEKNDQAPPPGKDLGVDADGSAGSDGFGLIGRKGGRDLLGGGRFGWYGDLVKSGIYDALMRDDNARKASYSIVVEVWLSAQGEIQRLELEHSTGDPDIDASIKKALPGLRVSEAPPADLPQPIKIRIATRL
jgi:periplasmic protein TonB